MITLTMGKAIREYTDTGEHYLYVYRDGETILYVGKSV